MNTDTLKKIASLRAVKAWHETKVASIDLELKTLEEAALNEFINEGVPSMRVNYEATTPDGQNVSGVTTLYTSTQLWAKPKPQDSTDAQQAIIAELGLALEELGHPGIARLNVNVQTLSSIVREMTEGGAELPPRLAGLLDINEKPALRARAR